MANQKSLFADIPVPPRLPKVIIPREERQEIIDYFAALASQHDKFSYNGSRIQNVLSALETEDPIEDIMATAKLQRLSHQDAMNEWYQLALEMLYRVRHRIESKVLESSRSQAPDQ